MKVSVNWLKQFTDIDLSIYELVKKIGAQLGAVEEVIDLGKKYQSIVIARVVTCKKHPNADKLSLCTVDDGGAVKGVKRDKKGYVQVVCGAPNVKAGMLVVWLPPGTTVPNSYDNDPFVLEARELRGQASNGMLASASELAIGDDHTGIVEINEEKLKPGDDFAEAFELNDYIIDIENKMFTHRPDCFGILGVAREIAGITGKIFVSPKVYKTQNSKLSNQKSGLQLKVKNNIPELVPRFFAQVFEDITIGPSPIKLQTYLMRVGIRPINNIVDITNYYMVLTGQPTHAYDYDKLLKINNQQSTINKKEKVASIETRMSIKGDKLKLLNGKEITFDDDSTILITSGDKPVGIGGVMGGSDTEVDDNTKNIVLESANFDMYSIRRTSMKYGLFTDAVTRFNKGQSPAQCSVVVAWAADEIICNSGAAPGIIVDDYRKLHKPKAVRLSTKFTNIRLGSQLTADEMQEILENTEFEVERTDNKDELKVTPPFWRTDIEIAEDLVEEVGRLYGYDNLPIELPKRLIKPTPRNPMVDLKNDLRNVLSRAGANEVLTYSFVHGKLLEKAGQNTKKAFKLSNAISPDLQYYRLSLTPSLLDKVHPNIKAGTNQFALFEINKSHTKDHKDDDNGVPKEFETLAFVVTASDKLKLAGAAYYQARAFLDELADNLGLQLNYQPISDKPTHPGGQPFEPGRSARVTLDDKIIGVIGEYKPSVVNAFKLPAFTSGFEVNVSSSLQMDGNRYHRLSRFPSVEQDMSLKVPAKLRYGELEEYLKNNLNAPKDTTHQLIPLDIYNKKGQKHVTFRLRIASYVKTMTAGEVNKLLDDLAAKSKAKYGTERI